MTDTALHDAVKIGIVSISDRASSGVYEDQGLPALKQWFGTALSSPWRMTTRLIPDEQLRRDVTRVVTQRFGWMASLAIGGLVLTGLYQLNAVVCVDVRDAMMDYRFGAVFAVKMATFLALLVAIGLHGMIYGRNIRLECVQNAIEQAKTAANAILGKPKAYDPVPWFWSDQYEIKLQITGLLDGYDSAEIIGNPAENKFSVDYRKGVKLIAVDSVNDGRAHMMGRKRIAADLPEKV